MTQHKVIVADVSDPDQVMELVGYDFGVSRRGFMQVLGAGLLIAVAASSAPAQERGAGRREIGRRRQAPVRLDARLHLGKDGSITVLTGKVEGGQGARAEISQAAAEELGVPAESVQLVMADTALVPDDGLTAGSRTTPATVPAVRQACAVARAMLVALATKKGVAVEKLSYADLIGAKGLEQVAPADVEVTPVEEWDVMGKPHGRSNARDLVTGAHKYPRDIQRPGMLYGKVLRPPTFGAKLVAVNEKEAGKIDSAVGVRDADFVGVVAGSTHRAKKALLAIEGTAQWDAKPHPSSSELAEYLRRHVRDAVPANPFQDELDSAAKTVKATYFIPYVQHTPMEPRAAVAEWSGDGTLTVWTSTQNPFGVRRELAGAFHLPEEKVRVIVPDFGGGFGGKHTGECAVEAARLARAAGKPVALQWTRHEEFTWAYFRPAGVMDLEASLDGSGGVTSWYHLNINSGPQGVETPYRAAKKLCRHVPCDAPMRHGSYRALASTANNFARESFVDELAHAAGRDPLEYRLAYLEDPRLRAVLELAAEKFTWTAKRERQQGGGIGLACVAEKGSFVASCAEVVVHPESGDLRVVRIVQAFECGKVVNPENLRSQNQGGIVQALGPVLREASEFEAGRMANASLFAYRVPRAADVPEQLDVHLLDRPDLPSAGAGETPLIAVAPAVANAVFNAIGFRVRQLPIKISPIGAGR